MIWRVYISGALTGLPRPEATKAFYEALADVCAGAGMTAYVPHLSTDPLRYPELSSQEVYALDRSQVLASDLVIAYTGFPSLGVGMELEIAHQASIPVLLLAEEGTPLSRMARGCPAVIGEIFFNAQDEALERVRSWLREPGNLLLSEKQRPGFHHSNNRSENFGGPVETGGRDDRI
jgi:hypothetical protein